MNSKKILTGLAVVSAFAGVSAHANFLANPEEQLVAKQGHHVSAALVLVNTPLLAAGDVAACQRERLTIFAAANTVRAPVLRDMLVDDGVFSYAGEKKVASQAWHSLVTAMPKLQQRLDAFHRHCLLAIGNLPSAQLNTLNSEMSAALEPVLELQLTAVTQMTEALAADDGAHTSRATCAFAKNYADWLVRSNSYSDGMPTPQAAPYLKFRDTVVSVCKPQ